MKKSLLSLCLTALCIGFLSSRLGTADATPIYATRSAHACTTCHVEPVEWANPEMKKRKCSLDCAICHVSPTGGGLRTPSGQFYGREVLPRWGNRPSEHATSDDTADTAGYYSLFGGFGGWQAGDTPSEDVDDRYGNIDPDPTFRAGGDVRILTYAALKTQGVDAEKASVFPMQAELYLMGRPHKNIVLYGDMGLQSPRADTNILGLNLNFDEDSRDYLKYFRVRELFVKVDRLPYNGYVRAGRFNPGYGWRLSDHTAYIRRGMGFDQNRQVFGIEGGINPNYPYANASLFAQGLDAWPGDTGEKGWGLAFNGGLRQLGWQLGGSTQFLSSAVSGTELALGPQWSVNLNPVVILGELDFKQNFTHKRSTLAGYTEVNWLMTWGLTGSLKFEYIDPDLSLKDDHKNRIALGATFHPYSHIELQAEYRQTFTGGTVFLIQSQLTSHELLVMVHTWF